MTSDRWKATIYPIVPEPCSECAEGLAWIRSFDGVLRCRQCVHRFAVENGLYPTEVNQAAEGVDPIKSPPPPRETYEQPRML
jgi:ribosomal protein L37AE/L43A